MVPASAMDERWEVVAQRLGQLLGEPNAAGPAPVDFEPGPRPGRVVAVDGSSSAIAESGAFVVGVHRAASVTLDGSQPPRIDAPPPDIALLDRRGVDPETVDRFQEAGFAEGFPRPESMLHLLRALDELDASLAALNGLTSGDLLLIDGALRFDPFPTLVRRLLDEAKSRGVDVVGVCKSTSMTIGNVPALAASHLAARRAGLGRWYVELAPPSAIAGRVFIANLTIAETRAFRFDIVSANARPVETLARLVPLAGHPAYPGYPSPLAIAHNAATIPEDERLHLRARLEHAAGRHGVTPDAWRMAFEDYHDILDLGV